MTAVNIVVQTVDKSTQTLKQISGAVKDIGTSAQSAVKTGVTPLTVALGTGLYDVSRRIMGGLTGMISNVVQTGISFDNLKQQANIAFTTMLGSGEKAKVFMDDLQKFAAATPFEFADLITASQRLMAMGFAAEKVKPMLTSVGDAVAALGGGSEKIDRVTMALGQMQAKGKVSAEEMLQLTEAGIPAWELLAEKIGVSIPEAQEKAKKGAIDTKTAIEGIVEGLDKRFGGMMEQQSHTWGGLVSTLKDTFTQLSGTVMQPFFDFMVKGLQIIIDFVSADVFGEWMVSIGTAIETNLGPPLEWLFDLFSEFFSHLESNTSIAETLHLLIVKFIPDSVLAQFEGFLSIVIMVWEAVGNGIEVVKNVVTEVLSFFTNTVTLSDALTVFGGIIAATVIPMITGIVTAISPVLLSFGSLTLAVSAVRTAWENDLGGIRTFVENTWEWLRESFGNVVIAWATFGGTLIGNLGDIGKEIFAFVTGADTDFETIKKTLDHLQSVFRMTWNTILKILQDNLPIWKEHLAAFADAAWRWIQEVVIPKVTDLLGRLWSFIREWASNNLPQWANVLLQWGEAAFKWIADVTPKVIDKTRELFGGLIDFVKGERFQQWVRTISEWVQVIREWFENRIPPIIDRVRQAINGIVEFVRGPTFQQWFNKIKEWYEVLRDWFQNKIPPILEEIRKKFTEWKEKLEEAIKYVQDKFAPFYNTLKDNLIPAAQEVIEFVKTGRTEFEALGEIWETLKTTLENIWSDIKKNVFDPIVDWLEVTLPDTYITFTNTFDQLRQTWGEVAAEFSAIFGSMNEDLAEHETNWKRVFDTTLAAILDSLGTILAQIAEVIKIFINIWKGDWEGVWDNILEIGDLSGELWNRQMQRLTGEMSTTIEEYHVDQLLKAEQFADDYELATKLLGNASVRGYVQGSEEKMQETIDVYKRIAKASAKAVEDELVMRSPSKVFEDIGKNTVQGMIDGGSLMIQPLVNTMTDLGSSMVNSLASAIENNSQKVQYAMQNVTSKIVTAVEAAKAEIEDLMDAISNIRAPNIGEILIPGNDNPVLAPGNFKTPEQFKSGINFESLIRFLGSRSLGQYDSQAFTQFDTRLRGGASALGSDMAAFFRGMSSFDIEAEMKDIVRYFDAVAQEGDYLNDFLAQVAPALKTNVKYLGEMLATIRGPSLATPPITPVTPPENKPFNLAEEIAKLAGLWDFNLQTANPKAPKSPSTAIFEKAMGWLEEELGSEFDYFSRNKEFIDSIKAYAYKVTISDQPNRLVGDIVQEHLSLLGPISSQYRNEIKDIAKEILLDYRQGTTTEDRDRQESARTLLADIFGGKPIDDARHRAIGELNEAVKRYDTVSGPIDYALAYANDITELTDGQAKDAANKIKEAARRLGLTNIMELADKLWGAGNTRQSESVTIGILNDMKKEMERSIEELKANLFHPTLEDTRAFLPVLQSLGLTFPDFNNMRLNQLPGVGGSAGYAQFDQNLRGFSSFFDRVLQYPLKFGLADYEMTTEGKALRELQSGDTTPNELISAVYGLVKVIRDKGIKPPLNIEIAPRTGDILTDLVNVVNYINALEGVA